MFQVDLRTQVPMYSADKPNWGGPACCQMTMNGYPPGATKCYITQTSVWNYAQKHNKEPGLGPWGIGWYADPFAVTKALNDLCPPQHSWVDVSGTSKEGVLYTLFRWMANYKYASLVCTFAHDYWKTLVYYRTSDDPRMVTNPTIEYVGFYEPHSGGVASKMVDGPTWMQSPAYWGQPCPSGQIWKNKWVGIGEPPEVEGDIQAETISRVGKALISPRDAAGIARRFLAEWRREESDFLLGHLTGVRAVRPMLVRELSLEQAEQGAQGDVRYYLVPFVSKYEVDDTGAPLARLSVLVNAYTGRFEELCMFPQPVRYLSQREAIQIASGNLGLSQRELSRIEVELVFRPLPPHVSSVLPAWKVVSGDLTFFVTQEGLVLGTLYYTSLRGA